jgi:hypothetical protein
MKVDRSIVERFVDTLVNTNDPIAIEVVLHALLYSVFFSVEEQEERLGSLAVKYPVPFVAIMTEAVSRSSSNEHATMLARLLRSDPTSLRRKTVEAIADVLVSEPMILSPLKEHARSKEEIAHLLNETQELVIKRILQREIPFKVIQNFTFQELLSLVLHRLRHTYD